MSLVSAEQIKHFHRDGYVLLESVIPDDVVAVLRQECMRYIDIFEQEMEAKGQESRGINHYKKRYFAGNRSADSPIMSKDGTTLWRRAEPVLLNGVRSHPGYSPAAT